MIAFVIVAAALIGWVIAEGEAWGLLLGGLAGWPLGAWLRSEIRIEIQRGIAAALAESREHRVPGLTDAPQRQAPEGPPVVSSPPAPPMAGPPAEPVRPSAPAMLRPAEPEPVHQHEPAEPTAADRTLAAVKEWFFGGNTIVRVGLVILFVGLSFLARYAASAGLFPIELRLALVGAIGVALLAVGFNRRTVKPAFALALQGGGVAVLYLTIFASARMFDVMPPLLAFGLMIVICALGCALALLQNAQGMALAAFIGGYAVPVLLGGESRTPVPLFSYISILNIAVLTIAWRRSWRPLNLVGFFATFSLATAWGFASYGPQHFLACQLFLALSVAIYLAAALLYAHNTPGKLDNAADSTLLFGTALAGFGLEVGLVQNQLYGSAIAALVFGAVYVAVAAWTIRKRDPAMRLMGESLIAIGLGFVTLAIPLALDVRWTSAAWALEGAGAFWIGARQARWMPRLFGLLLQGMAALIALTTLQTPVSNLPFLNNGFFGALLIAAPLLFTAWQLRGEALPHSGSRMARAYAPVEGGLGNLVFFTGFGFACIGVLLEVLRYTPAAPPLTGTVPVFADWAQVLLAMLGMQAVMAVADWFGRRRNWPVATWPGRLSLAPMVLALPLTLALDRHVAYLPDLAAWLAAAALHLWLLYRWDKAAAKPSRWSALLHAAGVWLLTLMLADCLYLAIDRADLWNTSWAGVIYLVAVIAVLGGLTFWTQRGRGWPLDPHARAYGWSAALPLAAATWLGALLCTWLAEGITAPLPYVPVINPVDLSVGLALAALVAWRRMAAERFGPGGLPGSVAKLGPPADALLAFVAVNCIWLRTAHHWLGVGWSGEELGDSPIVQTGISILWTLMAMGLMLYAKRRALRPAWLLGAGLLAVVVAKLLLFDMSRAEGWERIVTFIGVGLLMLVIGYFVPLPPRQKETSA